MHTITARAPQHPRRSVRGAVAVVAIGLAVAVAFLTVNGLVRDPDVVPRIEIRNQTDDLVDVLVRGAGGGSLLPVAIVEPQRRAVAHDVVDQGDTWTFVVRRSGTTIARIRLTRDQLVRSGWTVTVGNDAGAPVIGDSAGDPSVEGLADR